MRQLALRLPGIGWPADGAGLAPADERAFRHHWRNRATEAGLRSLAGRIHAGQGRCLNPATIARGWRAGLDGNYDRAQRAFAELVSPQA